MIYSYLIHLGTNMWLEPLVETDGITCPKGWSLHTNAEHVLRCDDDIFHDITERLAAVGCNMLLIDVGDAIQYASHPEISVEGAWSREKLSSELDRLRKMGIEPVPKLNFSTCHDYWLGEYARMVSTPKYYEVVRDVISEVCDAFGKPRFIHIGMDEETPENQRLNNYMVVRQRELWWHDFRYIVSCCEAAGSRPWIWSDYVWKNHDLFYERMPHSVLQSNWYYGGFQNEDDIMVKTYDELSAAGYEQIPTGSIWSRPDNMALTVDYCIRHKLIDDKMLGFMQAPWFFTLPDSYDRLLASVEDMKNAISLLQ